VAPWSMKALARQATGNQPTRHSTMPVTLQAAPTPRLTSQSGHAKRRSGRATTSGRNSSSRNAMPDTTWTPITTGRTGIKRTWVHGK